MVSANIFIIIIIISNLLVSSASLGAAHDYFEVQKVSGDDDEQQKETLIVQKFRTLFGLKGLRPKRPSYGHDSENVSPSPAPSPASQPPSPAPAPTPPLPLAVHSHHPQTESNPKTAHHASEGGKARRILVPVLVSAGAAFLVCVLGLTLFCCKFRKQYKKSSGSVSVFRKSGKKKGKPKYITSQRSAGKMNVNPGLDLFYLNSLGIDLEQQSSCLKQSNENVNMSSPSSTHALQESEELKLEVNKTLLEDNASSSSTKEITSVHEDDDSVGYESDGIKSSAGDKVVPIECNSSDDESFHSFADSLSSNIRLSNASACSFSDTVEVLSPNVMKTASFSTNLPIPPPPPPPPRLPNVAFSSSSKKLSSEASSSSTLPNVSPARISYSSSGSNQTPQTDLASPQKSPLPPPGIPPPPCPPPLLNYNKNSLKGPPPPPPALFPQSGKDVSPLPKLKPLHWDKVRAAPDRGMVWDKIRSSSFE